ncbi:MAG: hypothetical protein UV98_C0021G0005 [Parcubacteria group bacterium GW2011_GWB1_43_6]|nr:MAG: hypothetical protein UV98_C0021G0005 [Parcubacteria group bacterium GW2011_GWB1_43_6]
MSWEAIIAVTIVSAVVGFAVEKGSKNGWYGFAAFAALAMILSILGAIFRAISTLTP